MNASVTRIGADFRRATLRMSLPESESLCSVYLQNGPSLAVCRGVEGSRHD